MNAFDRTRRECPPPRSRGGLTFMELLIVVSIIAILASIALPRFAGLIRKANEGATRGKLGSIRTALAIYYADLEGVYPTDLTPLMQPGSKYLTQVVPLYTGAHGTSNNVNYVSAFDEADSGGWAYINQGGDWGHIWVQCTHTDSKSNIWNKY